jgi:hypothetical protein
VPDTRDGDRPETPAQRLSWVVRMHYRMRTAAFGMLFLAVCLHARVETVRIDVWLFLGLLLIAIRTCSSAGRSAPARRWTPRCTT